jgi:hypothetical protein
MVDLWSTVAEPDVWPAILAEVERQATAAINRHGALRLTTHAGVFVCA